MLGLFSEMLFNEPEDSFDYRAAPSSRPPVGPSDATLRLEARVDKLTLICMALWTLLKDATNLTDEQLAQRVKEIDLSDGRLDGKISHTVHNCPKCNRVLSQKHKRCLYCGYELPQKESGPFDEVTS